MLIRIRITGMTTSTPIGIIRHFQSDWEDFIIVPHSSMAEDDSIAKAAVLVRSGTFL